MFSDVVFLIVCGGGVEYSYLYGTLPAQLAFEGARIVVFDTCRRPEPIDHPRIIWKHAPKYGKGMRFDLVGALNDAMRFLKTLKPEPQVVVRLDCDEYILHDAHLAIERARGGSVIHMRLLHHLSPNLAINMPPHRPVRIHRLDLKAKRVASSLGPFHPELFPAPKIDQRYVPNLHHVHLAVGPKASDLTTAKLMPGFPHRGKLIEIPDTWPAALKEWRNGRAPVREDVE